MKVPVNEPIITDASKRYVTEAMESGWISSAGKYIDAFEKKFAEFLGVKHAITTTSGTTALHLALVALGVGERDEVIVADFTMFGSIAAILYTGATPVFVDAEADIYTLDVSQIEAKITPRTKAIMPVHLYGHSADMDPLLALAKKHGIAVVEDAAEAHGATYKGRMCGAMGTLNAFSFYGNKILTTGEGGMVTTNDDALAAKARMLKDLAHVPGQRFWHEELGFNYRMTNLQAACGLGQLEHVAEFLERKKTMAERYAKGLAGIPGLRLPITRDWAHNVYWMYTVLLQDAFPMTREEFRKKLADKGIDTRDFFHSSARQPAVRTRVGVQGPFTVSERIAERGMYLPSGLALTDEQIEYVCEMVREVAGA